MRINSKGIEVSHTPGLELYSKKNKSRVDYHAVFAMTVGSVLEMKGFVIEKQDFVRSNPCENCYTEPVEVRARGNPCENRV